MIDILFVLIVFGIFIIYSFIKGIQIGQKLFNNKDVEIINPINVIQKHIENKNALEEEQKSKEIDEINLYNIENYNGTSVGQKDFPKNETR